VSSGVSYRVRAKLVGVNLAEVELRYWLTYPTECPQAEEP
jgi:hypothetical protein